MLIDNIVEKEHELYNRLCKREESNPLILFGAGQSGHNVLKALREWNKLPSYIAVNEKYLSEEKLIYEGYEVVSLEAVLKANPKCDLIIAFRGYEEGSIAQYKEHVGEIYDYDIWAERIPYLTYSFIKDHADRLEKVYANVADEKSKEVLLAYINQRISGKYGYLKAVKSNNQYYDDIVPLYEKNVFVDCGAYDGDTAIGFAEFCKKRNKSFQKIVSFEMDETNIANYKANVQLPNIELIEKGVWSHNTTLFFNDETADTSREIVTTGTVAVSVDSIDNVMQGQPVTMIKMDIEGSEMEALKGASMTISQYHPVLAICIYHRPEDLYEIYELIHSIYSEYKFYIRAYEEYSTELVLYAIPKE